MEEILHSLSYLFYAVARSDRRIEKEEKAKIHELINDNWKILARKGDPFGVKAVELIDKMIAELDEDEYDSETALRQFKSIYDANREQFTPELKQFILDVCMKTAHAFNQMNKSELVILSRIENVLKDKG